MLGSPHYTRLTPCLHELKLWEKRPTLAEQADRQLQLFSARMG